MAGNLINTLYPPIVDTFMPAFPYNEYGIIYFSLSPYNSPSMISKLHISLTDSATNHYALKNKENQDKTIKIIDGILIIPFNEEDIVDKDIGLYAVRIDPQWLNVEIKDNGETAEAQWQIGRFYQAQIRLDKYDGNISDKYLIDYRQYFSEWSNVTLLRPIDVPTLYFPNYDGEFNTQSTPLIYTDGVSVDSYRAYPQQTIEAYNKYFRTEDQDEVSLAKSYEVFGDVYLDTTDTFSAMASVYMIFGVSGFISGLGFLIFALIPIIIVFAYQLFDFVVTVKMERRELKEKNKYYFEPVIDKVIDKKEESILKSHRDDDVEIL